MFPELEALALYKTLMLDFMEQCNGDDPLLSFFQLHLVLQGIAFGLVRNRVFISQLSGKMLKRLQILFEPGKCYYNSYLLCQHVPGAKYVLGFWGLDAPVEHAWVRIGDRYYDPTYQLFLRQKGLSPSGYFPVVELSRSEFQDLHRQAPTGHHADLVTYFGSRGILYQKLM